MARQTDLLMEAKDYMADLMEAADTENQTLDHVNMESLESLQKILAKIAGKDNVKDEL